jgi:hypothetical protein
MQDAANDTDKEVLANWIEGVQKQMNALTLTIQIMGAEIVALKARVYTLETKGEY